MYIFFPKATNIVIFLKTKALAFVFPPKGQAEAHAVSLPLAIFFPALRFGQKLP